MNVKSLVIGDSTDQHGLNGLGVQLEVGPGYSCMAAVTLLFYTFSG